MAFPTVQESFENTPVDLVVIGSERWIRGTHIGAALGFADPKKSVKDIYTRNQREFDDSTTLVMEMPTAGGRQLVRLYNARGAALIAMKAKTPKAEAFRRWVLDVLEGRDDQTHVAAVTGFPPGVMSELRKLFYERKGMIALIRYVQMGLGTSEISRLLSITPEYINRKRRMGEALGLIEPPASLEKMRNQAGWQKLIVRREEALRRKSLPRLAARSGEPTDGE